MSKIFVSGDKIDNDNVKITFTHYDPLNEKNGLSKDLLETGYLVDSLPPQEEIVGKIPELYYSIPREECYWQYTLDAPPAPVSLSEVNDKLDLVMQMLLESEGIL